MILRSGYVRDCDGDWINMLLISEFYVGKNEEDEYQIFVKLHYNKKLQKGDCIDRVVSQEYSTEQEAYDVLDDAMGFHE